MIPQGACRRIARAAVVDFFGKPEALLQRRLVIRAVAAAIAPPGELAAMILLPALPDDGADIGREQDAARAIHDDVADREFAARRLAARLVIDRQGETADLPVLVGIGRRRAER